LFHPPSTCGVSEPPARWYFSFASGGGLFASPARAIDSPKDWLHISELVGKELVKYESETSCRERFLLVLKLSLPEAWMPGRRPVAGVRGGGLKKMGRELV
jgi:hypothetical protein